MPPADYKVMLKHSSYPPTALVKCRPQGAPPTLAFHSGFVLGSIV